MMKTKLKFMALAGVVLTSPLVEAQTTSASELERGVELLEGEADATKAIPHFENVVRSQKESSRLAAEAYYYLAKCHLALGDAKKARECVASLRKGWPADNTWVLRATNLPLRNSIFKDAPWESGELLTYGVIFNHDGEEIDSGRFCTLLVAGEDDDTWTHWGLVESFMATYEFGGDRYLPTKGRFMALPTGDQIMERTQKGDLILRPRGIDKPIATFPHAGEEGDVYHHLQLMELVRVLPDKLGTPHHLSCISPLGQAESKVVKVTATEYAEIEVPAGKFNCVAYQIDADWSADREIYWVERDGRRRVVKLETGSELTFSLLSSEREFRLDQSSLCKTGQNPGSLSLKVPRGFVALPDPDRPGPRAEVGAEYVALFDTKLRVWSGLLERVPQSEKKRVQLEAGDLTADMIASTLEDMMIPLAKIEEVEEARMTIKEGGDTSVITRFDLERASLKHERTVLLTLEKGSVILCYFDHEPGAGDAAVELLKEIRSSL